MIASFSLHTPLMYLPNEQFAHPGPLSADSQLMSLHLSFPVIDKRQICKLVLGRWGWVCDYAKMLFRVDFNEELSLFSTMYGLNASWDSIN